MAAFKNNKSVVCQLKNAGKLYVSAEATQIKAVSAMYSIFKTAKSGSVEGKIWLRDIEKTYAKLRKKNSNVPNSRHLSNKIAWVSGVGNKQRVSDVHQLITAAAANKITSSNFIKRITDNGGIRATLNCVRSTKTNPSTANNSGASVNAKVAREKLFKRAKPVIFDLLESANNKRVTKENPTDIGLGSDEVVVQIVKREPNNKFAVYTVKLTREGVLHFPKNAAASGSTSQQTDSNAIDKIAALATLVEEEKQEQLPTAA